MYSPSARMVIISYYNIQIIVSTLFSCISRRSNSYCCSCCVHVVIFIKILVVVVDIVFNYFIEKRIYALLTVVLYFFSSLFPLFLQFCSLHSFPFVGFEENHVLENAAMIAEWINYICKKEEKRWNIGEES